MLSSEFINCPTANGNTTTLYIINIQKWYAHSVLWLLYATLTGHKNGNHVQLPTPTTRNFAGLIAIEYGLILAKNLQVKSDDTKIEEPNVAGQIYVCDSSYQ